ncbi:MAG: hypothetical protein ACTSR1_00880 [Candidatus Heimdallarchaeota archaeon]
MVNKKIFTLEGKILSPLISSTPLIKKGTSWIRIVRNLKEQKKPIVTYIGKLVKGDRKAPTKQKAFRGYVQVTTIDRNEERGRRNILNYLTQDHLGKKTTEGYGKVQWINYREENYQTEQQEPKRKKLKLRKGLGPNYPKELQRLLVALMLHDFVKTEIHPSKIFQEITIEDEEIREACLNHHNGQLVKEIEERQHSAYKLYNYIYNSQELTRIVESMTYGYNSLRNHLLLMVNLAINNYHQGKIVITKGKIINRNIDQKTKKSISSSAT